MTTNLDASNIADPRNAAILCKACEFAYMPAEEGAEAFRSQLGLEASLISVDNTQAYVGTNDDSIVVAFRGSESPTSIDGLKDWLLTNANNFLIVPEGNLGTDYVAAGVGARFHQGFMGALAEIWDKLYATVDAEFQKKERPIWVTGHSLGGAIALLAAWRFQRNFLPVTAIITFGAPMIGNDIAAKAFEGAFANKIYRYVGEPDPVPLLPTVSLVANSYLHCLNEVRLGQAVGTAVAMFQELGSEAVDGIMSGTLMDKVWDQLKQRIGSHDLSYYQKQIAEKCQA